MGKRLCVFPAGVECFKRAIKLIDSPRYLRAELNVCMLLFVTDMHIALAASGASALQSSLFVNITLHTRDMPPVNVSTKHINQCDVLP